MIRFENVSITYPHASSPALSEVTLHVPEGELALVVGRTGAGKSTLLRAVNGLVPHFSGGLLTGRVSVDGRDTEHHPPRELADLVGACGQVPDAGFVTSMVEDELAYAMESLGLSREVMRRRVEETLDLLGLADLRNRPLRTLSGGQKQRVAIGAVLTAHPRVLVLDEPTSALDPVAAEEVLAALQRLVGDLGMTVLLAEHRLERVVQYADRVIVIADGRVTSGDPATVMASAPVAPPVVELAKLAGWSPVPLSVRDARRLAAPLRATLCAVPGTTEHQAPGDRPLVTRPSNAGSSAAGSVGSALPAPVQVSGLVVRYGSLVALRGVDLVMRAGEITALMGRNGAGKSTLLASLAGLRKPDSGRVRLAGEDPAALTARQLLRRIGLVPQDPADLLCEDTVAAELALADIDAGLQAGTTAKQLERLAPDVRSTAHPSDLSEGQRLALTLALVLAAKPGLLALDEPTRGLDYGAKRDLVTMLRELAGEAGTAVLLATHDVELVAELADRVVVLADGEVVADGPTAEVVMASPAFAPQVSKVLAPAPWLTVAQVRRALAATA